jgi:hypothetical protein
MGPPPPSLRSWLRRAGAAWAVVPQIINVINTNVTATADALLTTLVLIHLAPGREFLWLAAF